MGKKFAAFDASGNITAFYDDEDSPVPDGVQSLELSHDQWMTCITAQACTVVGGELILPTQAVLDARANEVAWSEKRLRASDALVASDVIVLRCYERGISVPMEWVTYRDALRAVVREAIGDPDSPLPDRPADIPAL